MSRKEEYTLYFNKHEIQKNMNFYDIVDNTSWNFGIARDCTNVAKKKIIDLNSQYIGK